MKITSILQTLFAALILAALAVHAQSVYPPNPAYANNQLGIIYPYRGAYYDPSQPGTGLMVEMGSSGSEFIMYYTYTPDGTPTWYILENTQYAPSDEVTRWTTGVLGTMTGDFYTTSGGQCLGCAYKPNGPEVKTNFSASLTWVNSREVKMIVGPQTWDFIAPNMDGKTDGDYLVGTWAIHFIQEYRGVAGDAVPGNFVVDNFATISISKGGQSPTVSADAAEGATAFKQGNAVYSWRCVEGIAKNLCNQAMRTMTYDLNKGVQGAFFFWFDPAANRLGMDVNYGGTISKANTHVDLYIQDPDLIVGRGITEGTGFDNNITSYNLWLDGAMNLQVVMQRLPTTTQGLNSPDNGLTP